MPENAVLLRGKLAKNLPSPSPILKAATCWFSDPKKENNVIVASQSFSSSLLNR
jgi:hypothetical protein